MGIYRNILTGNIIETYGKVSGDNWEEVLEEEKKPVEKKKTVKRTKKEK